ncbi:MAG: hypothetical protein J7556_00595 [Acidovorax sp.]|nr:hypothetical protein [Acidovorax sp.]
MILCLVALKALHHDFHGGREKGFLKYRISCRVAGFDNRPMLRCNLKNSRGNEGQASMRGRGTADSRLAAARGRWCLIATLETTVVPCFLGMDVYVRFF